MDKYSKIKFHIISRKISENFGNYFGKFGRIISEDSEKYFGKLSEIFLKISRNINEIFENYFQKFFFNFRKFRGLLRRILRFIP